MKKFFALFTFAFLAGLAACTTSGPQAALDKVARAMADNNPSQFLAGIDLPAYSANYLQNMTSSDMALNSINELGNLLGIGGLDKLIGSIVDVQARIKNEFERGIASGELMAQCSSATSPDCPWVPEALRNAHIVELGPSTAIARVTTPPRITSWLAMCKYGENWKIVGRAVMENEAREMANAAKPAQAPAKGAGKPVNI